MALSCGIIGLPNVGKSTLFNALTRSASASASNYPFCTIDPNRGDVAVPDQRLQALAEIVKPERITPTTISFTDIAGLVKGASKGEGLGNQFLGHIREVDALIHLVRCFDDDDITHVEGRLDPIDDIETIETELALADLESLERRRPPLEKKAKSQDKEAQEQLALIDEAYHKLAQGEAINNHADFAPLQLLSTKPQLYLANVSENDIKGNHYTKALLDFARPRQKQVMIIAAATEAELIALDKAEQAEYLQDLGLQESGLDRLITQSYLLLNLITFFTAGEKEARAWTCVKTMSAPMAAGKIHSHFEKKFIRAEIVSYQDFLDHRGAQDAAKAGKMRLEGKDYIVQDGDVVYFRIGQ